MLLFHRTLIPTESVRAHLISGAHALEPIHLYTYMYMWWLIDRYSKYFYLKCTSWFILYNIYYIPTYPPFSYHSLAVFNWHNYFPVNYLSCFFVLTILLFVLKLPITGFWNIKNIKISTYLDYILRDILYFFLDIIHCFFF